MNSPEPVLPLADGPRRIWGWTGGRNGGTPCCDTSRARGDGGGEGGAGGGGSAVRMLEAPEVGADPVIEECMVHLRKENWLPEIVAGHGPLPRRRRPGMQSAEAPVRPRGRGEGMSAAAKTGHANFG